jgi:hypothetical protein
MLASSAVDGEFELCSSSQTKDYEIGICCFSAKADLIIISLNINLFSSRKIAELALSYMPISHTVFFYSSFSFQNLRIGL